ncbi:MAG: hypothetical protein JWM82_2673 [Myxococcales bacterium]|nr:hypothetical protein [Myxococcales bacterium]
MPSTTLTRTKPWRSRAVRLTLALAGTALMTAFAAAEMGARPTTSTEALLRKTIRQQRVAQGLPAAAPETKPEAGPGGEALDTSTREGILAEAARIEAQINRSVTHIEQLRVVAYHDKNLIRMNFLTSKLDEMKQVMSILTPAFADIRVPGQDLFVMRAKLVMIRQGAERLRETAAAAESSLNDDSPDTMGDIGSSNAQTSPNAGETDPTLPPGPTFVNERPAPASTFQ